MSYNDLRKGRYSESGREYFVTMVVDQRRPFFSDFATARLLVTDLAHGEAKGACLWLGWVIMPDHFHGLLRLQEESLSDCIKRLKAASANRINQHLGRRGRFWQPGFYDRALRAEDDRRAIARYMIANPLRAGLVEHIGMYPHWDCIWL